MLYRSRIRYSPWISYWLIRLQYELISALKPHDDLLFMNFGYDDSTRVELEARDEVHRYSLQLYHHLARQIEWSDRNVLEVSCGRGGGASYIMRYFKPSSYLGVDISAVGLDFCRYHHRIPGLTFQHANAEELPFADASFDTVINVEASLYYPNLVRFLQGVKRVLKPGGYFLYTDLRFQEEECAWIERVADMGLKVIHQQDITENVLKGLALDRERRIYVVDRYVPFPLRKQFYALIGLRPEAVRDLPQLPNRRYWSFILQK